MTTTDKPVLPVEHAIATAPCAKCGAAIGVPCKFKIKGRMHEGAHTDRIRAAHPGDL